jgi:hypothetical protein
MHTPPPPDENPTMQTHASNVDEPAGELELGGQPVHTLAPGTAPYVPAPQRAQAVAPPSAWKRPGSHGTHPAGPEVSPVTVEYVPAGQFSHTPTDSQYVPAEQLKHAVAGACEVSPAAHASQVVWPGLDTNCPRGHGTHADAPKPAENVPAWQGTHVPAAR